MNRSAWVSTRGGALRPAPGPPADRLEALIRRLVTRQGLPHAVLVVERGDGAWRWVGAEGQARPGGAPMSPATPFFIASIDKVFTASAVMQLVERGLVALEARLVDYLPPGRLAGLHRLDGVDHTAAITVRHLLSHTSGLADYLEDRPRGGRSLVERLLEEGDREVSDDEALALVRGRLRPHFPPQPLAAAGRPRIRYSDTNYLLLILLVEAVTGETWPTLFHERFVRPLGLHHTWMAGLTTPLEPTVEPAAVWAGDRPVTLPLALRSLRSVYSTAGDLIAFLRSLVSGRLFDEASTVRTMQRPWLRFGLPLDRAALRAPSWPIEYGLGLMRFRLPRWLTPLGPVPAVIGHTGSTGSWLFHCPERDLWLAGTVDQATAGAVPFGLSARVLQLING